MPALIPFDFIMTVKAFIGPALSCAVGWTEEIRIAHCCSFIQDSRQFFKVLHDLIPPDSIRFDVSPPSVLFGALPQL